jgi:hypothetical protein
MSSLFGDRRALTRSSLLSSRVQERYFDLSAGRLKTVRP